MVAAARRLGRDAALAAVGLGATGSVASAPCTALRLAAVASMSAMGFMEPSVALAAMNLNHEFDIAIEYANAGSAPPAHLSRGSPSRFVLPRRGAAVAHPARRLAPDPRARAPARDPPDRPPPRRASPHRGRRAATAAR